MYLDNSNIFNALILVISLDLNKAKNLVTYKNLNQFFKYYNVNNLFSSVMFLSYIIKDLN